jgi:hypothetical protein
MEPLCTSSIVVDEKHSVANMEAMQHRIFVFETFVDVEKKPSNILVLNILVSKLNNSPF